MQSIKKVWKETGELPPYAWPGGYQLIFITEYGDVLCHECATKQLKNPDIIDPKNNPVAMDIHYEGPSEWCAECNKELESECGDPWEEKE